MAMRDLGVSALDRYEQHHFPSAWTIAWMLEAWLLWMLPVLFRLSSDRFAGIVFTITPLGWSVSPFDFSRYLISPFFFSH